ncbi:MAG: hypothetical protein Ct9H300mP1_20340 [Planctomycetaceae bacterium]|nr:MAG: hypothetical protein Ct9H300mP1_20340 [Planctomycetaceae bacterium]
MRAAGCYRAYWGYFTEGITEQKVWKPAGLRAIRTATSDDFFNWKKNGEPRFTRTRPKSTCTPTR